MMTRFFSGSSTPRELLEKAFARVDRDDVEVQHVAKAADDLLRFVLAQQAVIDEDAGELLADRARDRASRQPPNRRRPRARR